MRDANFEWDDRKAAGNLRKHEVSFAAARDVFADLRAIDKLDVDEADEDRILLTGMVNEELITVCFVERGYRKRIISARRASRRERDDYNEANA